MSGETVKNIGQSKRRHEINTNFLKFFPFVRQNERWLNSPKGYFEKKMDAEYNITNLTSCVLSCCSICFTCDWHITTVKRAVRRAQCYSSELISLQNR